MADSDYYLALELQAEFDKEFVSDFSSARKVPKVKSPILIEDNDVSPAKRLKTDNLIDPEWEVIDPTPDIYGLFMNFNKRYFWDMLGSVEVRWSPRMYSCAGVCSYDSRSGLCSVRLSEPLLKLRPRSDLIETLLHEMIHAYLFVTQNNRDRDGHGPEFRKHMCRINKTAGINITIYHSFHEEVKLYQKHWWRCDGICKNKPPFFGFVKRSMNRAPGPNDFWWTTHQATCGGKYIKVREPDKAAGKAKKTMPKTSNIDKYVIRSPKKSLFKTDDIKKPIENSVKKPQPPTNMSHDTTNRVTGFNDLNKTNVTKLPKSTFNKTDKSGDSVSNNVNKLKRPGSGAVMNKGTGVLTLTSGSNSVNTVKTSPTKSDTFSPFSGKGYTLGVSSLPNKDSYPKPVSSLLTRFAGDDSKSQKLDSCSTLTKGGCSSNNSNKNSRCNNKIEVTPEKYKDDFFNESLSDDDLAVIEVNDDRLNNKQDRDDNVNCPVCNMKTNRDDMSIHLQSCDILNKTLESMNNSSTLEMSGDDTDESGVVNDQPGPSRVNMLPCPCCSKSVIESDINKHLDECLSLLTIKEFENDW